MNQIRGLLRDTWWLWLLMYAGSFLMAIFVTPIYLFAIPILIGSMVYFAMMRYDKDGNAVGDSGDQFKR